MFVLLILFFRNGLLAGALDSSIYSGSFALRFRVGAAYLVLSLRFPFLIWNGGVVQRPSC